MSREKDTLFDNFIERVCLVIKTKATITSAALALGMTRQALQNHKLRGSLPEKQVFRFAKETNVSSEWLLTGEGEIYEKPPVPEALRVQHIPVLGRVPAGFPEDVSGQVLEYISLPDAPARSYALVVKGESMSPGIKDGDYVLFVSNGDYKSGDIVVVNNEFGDSMIKRYRIKPDGEVWLMSDNPEYPSFKPNEHYRIVGKVVGGVRMIKI